MAELNNKLTGSDGQPFDPSKVRKLTFAELAKKIGPGIILTGIVLGPGNITTSAMMGADYGYQLMWLIFPIMFMGVTFMISCYRITLLTGMPIIHAIRHFYGKIAAGIVGVAVFLACLFFTFGNVTGTGAGMNLIFGIDWRIGSIIMLAVLMWCYFTKGVYSKVEKGMLACVLAMIVAFYWTLIATGGPVWGEFGKGLAQWKIPTDEQGNIIGAAATTALAYISTNAAVTAGIYGTYLGAEKKWKKEDLFNRAMMADSIVHVITVILISGAIILVGAIVLNPQGIAIKAPAQLGDLLRPALGDAAPIVMGIAIIAAGFSSLLGNTQRGVVLLGAGFDKPVGLETKFVRWGSVICLVVACIVCFSYNGSPTQLIFLANVATAVATPFGGLFIMLMLWKKEVQMGLKAPRALQICMTISYIFAVVMTISALQNTIPKLIAAFTPAA